MPFVARMADINVTKTKRTMVKKDDLAAFVQERADEIKKLANEKGYDNATTISAAFNTAMFVIADMYADEAGFEQGDLGRDQCGFDLAEQFIICMGKRFQKERKKNEKSNKD